MKKLLALAGLVLLAGLPAHAQFSRITSVTLENNNNTQAAFYASPFEIKVGTHCTWSISGTVATLDCSGGAPVTPGSPTNSIQFNSAGSFGGVANLVNGSALDCDGAMDACTLKFTNGGLNPFYMIYGSDGTGFVNMYEEGGLFLTGSSDGTHGGSLGMSEVDGNTFLTANNGGGVTGLNLQTTQRLVAQGRLMYSTSYLTAIAAMNFTLGTGWGSTASVTNAGGSDNIWLMEVTTGGAGIAANPQFTFTYANGDMSTGGSTVIYLCSQSGGNDIIADVVTTTRNQTNEVFTWHGTPTTGKVYEITCQGAATN